MLQVSHKTKAFEGTACTDHTDALSTAAHLKDRLWGAMGVITIHGTLGATIGPPADMLYAVEPEGVATMTPSPCISNTLACCICSLKCAKASHLLANTSGWQPSPKRFTVCHCCS